MILDSIQNGFIEQFVAPFLPSKSLFYLYLGSALLISTLTYIWFSYREEANRPDGISKGLWGYIFDKDVWLHRSARQDYIFFVVNALIYHGILAHFLISGHVAFGAIDNGLVFFFGVRTQPFFEPSLATTIAYTTAVILAVDFAIYLTHYIQHKFPPLWHFHSVHHSAEVLNVITVFRQHPVDLFFTGTFIVVLSQLAFAGFTYMTMVKPTEILILNVNVVLFGFFLFGYNLRHSHIWLAYPAIVSHILISPAQHQTHHSVDPKHFDRNFGFIFAFWDWLFGTLYVPRGFEKLEFGICREEPNPYETLSEIYILPFKRAWVELNSSEVRIRSVVAIAASAIVGICLVLFAFAN
ncbi:sterol desaturase family protein [Boseongicola aestuarii]|uniref:Fatty acid hydroxylase superfamily protein n=1 Tax=Boseongicola aestuarii TaxID=1470561 RepID=A0A238IUT9_9RHOB|nr:sterol desaturase family protein [Boseongicola aestuarii]SMX22056.1 Fatty acid hydroxylase superfamily protein [Boseongicola aestuarii]